MIGRALAAGLAIALAASADAQQVDISSGSVVEIVEKLRAGQFVWAPEVAPEGPMLMIINIKSQRAILYRNGVPIGATTVSTGRPGRVTPTGVFTILQKQVVHYSSKYDSAPMPYMQRLTWYGVALHAGHLPGYPASHGCIRMPAGFAKLLYAQTHLGMTVIITNTAAAPRIAPAPTIAVTEPGEVKEAAVTWNPEKAPQGPVSVIVSAGDGRALVLRNGIVIGSAPVEVKGPVSGTWAYALRNIDQEGQHWVRVSLSGISTAEAQVPRAEWQRFSAPESFRKEVASIVAPGMTIIITPDSLRSAAAPATVLESGN